MEMKRKLLIFLLLLPMLLHAQHRPKVALVLGGGGAKGAAHVGVLKYIEESGIPIDIVVGTSIGSIVGGLYSIGYDSQELDSLFRAQQWPILLTDRVQSQAGNLLSIENDDLYVLGFHFNLNPDKRAKNQDRRYGALKGDSITSLFETLVAARIGREATMSCNFDALPRRFRAMAYDITDFREVTLSEGSLPLSMRASMSIPLAFRPVRMGDHLYIDGGVMNNLPVDVARAMGADYVIAVDLAVNHHDEQDTYLEDVLGISNEVVLEGKGRFAGLNLINWGLFRPDIALYHRNCENADIYINPDLAGFGAHDFVASSIATMIRLGEEAGLKALPQLQQLRREFEE